MTLTELKSLAHFKFDKLCGISWEKVFDFRDFFDQNVRIVVLNVLESPFVQKAAHSGTHRLIFLRLKSFVIFLVQLVVTHVNFQRWVSMWCKSTELWVILVPVVLHLMNISICNVLLYRYVMQFGAVKLKVSLFAYLTLKKLKIIGHVKWFVFQQAIQFVIHLTSFQDVQNVLMLQKVQHTVC